MTVVRWLPLLLAGAVLAACRTSPPPPPAEPGPEPVRAPVAREWHTDGPPDHIPPGLDQLPEPVPRLEPRSARGNPPSYRVNGRTYQVWDSAEGYYATGDRVLVRHQVSRPPDSSGEPYDCISSPPPIARCPFRPTCGSPTSRTAAPPWCGSTTAVRSTATGSSTSRSPRREAGLSPTWDGAGAGRGAGNEWARTGTAAASRRDRRQSTCCRPERFETWRRRICSRSAEQLTGQPGYVVRADQTRSTGCGSDPVTGRSEAQRLQALIVAADDFDEPMILRSERPERALRR
jgi:hypothetical protein